MNNVADSFPQTVKVDSFIVHKLQLDEYALVFEKLQKLPGLLAEFTNASQIKIMASIPKLVSQALPEVIEILAIATHTPRDEMVKKMDAKTAVRCLKAVFQLNDFFGLWEEIQSLVGEVPEAVPPPKEKQ